MLTARRVHVKQDPVRVAANPGRPGTDRER
jgi:hypothetical protein